MATEPPAPTPPSVQVPQWVISLLRFLAATVKSPFLHSLITAALAAFGTVYLAKQALPDFLPSPGKPLIPRILPKPKHAEEAIGKIQFGNAGCTGTIIGPVMSNDDKLQILTAAHCVKLGAVGTMKLKDGRVLNVKCVARDPEADAAWLSAANPGGDVPYLLLADSLPNDGEAVWHQGYGIDRPGNRESGIFRGTRQAGLQCQFRLSVSPGDSGGGIILDTNSRVVSPVCCTTRLSAVGDVFGASPIAAARIRPHKTAEDDEPMLIYPVLPLEDQQPEVLPAPQPSIVRDIRRPG